MSPGIVPVAKALYLCDNVLEDSSSHKIHLIGLLNSIHVAETAFPYRLKQLCVFAVLLDGLGSFAGTVDIVNARTGDAIYTSPERPLVLSSRTQTLYACFRIQDCPFPEPGEYLIEFYCQGAFMDDRLFRVITH